MRKLNIPFNKPIIQSLSTDSRFSTINYTDDQIWEVKFGEGNSPPLSIQTTLGLRAQQLRLLPRFSEDDLFQIDPKDYYTKPTIIDLVPNYISITLMPFKEIDVYIEILVPDSSTLVGRTKIMNLSNRDRKITFEWLCQLNTDNGQPMAPMILQAAPVLAGQTANLFPVFFMSGGPEQGKGSYPSLSISKLINSGQSESYTWILSSGNSLEKSFDKCIELTTTNWDAQISNIKMENSSLIEIYTGEKDWDLAFTLSQRTALGLIITPTEHLAHSSFVINRQPDQGFSLSGDGKDYNHLWNGQSPLDAYYIIQFILPMYPEIAAGILYNFLDNQLEDGFIDWKPGLGGQRSKILATPLLVSIAWEIYKSIQAKEYLEDVYPKLVKFIDTWLSVDYDVDNDGIPEWTNVIQTGYDDHPMYSPWESTSFGVNIQTSEGADLCAFLYRECRLLHDIAKILDDSDGESFFMEKAEAFFSHVHSFWSNKLHAFSDRDKDTHSGFPTSLISDFFGSGMLPINKKFKPPTRLLFHFYTQNDLPQAPDIFIHGVSGSGRKRVEHITPDKIKWYPRRGLLTGDQIYKSIEFIEVQNFESSNQIILYSIGYEALTHNVITPLWAHAIDLKTADDFIHSTITNRSQFWSDYGMQSIAAQSEPDSSNNMVHINKNSMLIEGLIEYGFRDLAAELMNNLMKGITKSLITDFSFRRFYNPYTGNGVGERNALPGLAPINQFLQIVGIKIISPDIFILEGYNPFPWPVTVKYRGLTILKQKDRTRVVFPNGQTYNTNETKKQVISLRPGNKN